MRILLFLGVLALLPFVGYGASYPTPAPQAFLQEVAQRFADDSGLPSSPVQIVDTDARGGVRLLSGGVWYELRGERWEQMRELQSSSDEMFRLQATDGRPMEVRVPGREVRQILRAETGVFLATETDIYRILSPSLGSPQNPSGQDAAARMTLETLGWEKWLRINQIMVSPDGRLHVGSSGGLFRRESDRWQRIAVQDDAGREWAVGNVPGACFDSAGRLWFAAKSGVGCQEPNGWRFFEGKDGLPWNDFTCAAADRDGGVWFGTRLGAVHYDGRDWHYRQGPRWLPDDEITRMAIDAQGNAWFAASKGLGSIGRRSMTLAEKAEFYEREIERFVKRTPFGFVAEAALRKPGDKSSAAPQDSDNDGLWTAMYGAGECFAYGATRNTVAKGRARKAFEALRFLQKVTQNCLHAPPKGYVARTIRPVEWPDPNAGRLESDREEQKQDRLWKVYEPRWPKSADGKWYWKSDTSSDELDGHYFFYPLYFDLCADTEPERERVREVVRDLTDHLLANDFVLLDHDGRPTRWAIYGPRFLNHDPDWWPERGLKSLSMLSYLAVASHITGDPKYEAASRELIDRHAYAHNAMYVKLQHGPGSGNQSDDEMAVMCYYSLLRYSRDERLKALIRHSFYSYWVNEEPELNPFFNFAYAAHNLEAAGNTPWGRPPLTPWPGWLEGSIATLRGFPLDRINWPSRNSHRLDIVELARVQSSDLDQPDEPRRRGRRVNGKVLPVENRYFSHWNTDPWRLDYGGRGDELGAGTVFLLPYYMGLYHGFIELPAK